MSDDPAPPAPAAASPPLIAGLAHVNLTVPPGTLDQARAFYGGTLGLTAQPVPAAQAHELAWFDVGGPQQPQQQVHVSLAKGDADVNDADSRRHPCFRLPSSEALRALQRRIADHHARGGPGAPMAADRPGEPTSGSAGPEYPTRFFARDFAGNRLEFSL